jgi:hypothetical protein
MRFTVVSVAGLKLQLQKKHGSDGLTHYTLLGPPIAVKCLSKATDNKKIAASGILSPLSPVTVAGAQGRGMGVPEGGAEYGFSYPFAVDGELLLGAIRETDPAGGSNLPPWFFFVLNGGFVYFDRSSKLLRTNTLMPDVSTVRRSSQPARLHAARCGIAHTR